MYEHEIDVTKLKYVLYARKSTDDPERQVRSTEDQIAECKRMAENLGLHIVGMPIIEKKSAKKPGQRPLFDQMLRDIRNGKYDGILSWNPDRLARNMREGGEIIDMIDEEVIKDLKFVTHHFSPDANGKMLLGMAFVLSKQYSDKLSQDVTRGLHRKVEEGRSHIEKHGYKRDEEGRYFPDGNNHKLICDAWKMRLEGVSLPKIAKYLNDHGYYKRVKSSGKKIKMTKQILSVSVFKDPFYYGILIQGIKQIDLREAPYDFVPAISEAEFQQVQMQSGTNIQAIATRKSFYPFRAFVRCAYCDANMRVAPSSGSSKRYLLCRCDNPDCKRNSDKNKSIPVGNKDRIKISVRTKVVLDFIYDFLEEGLNLTEEDYNEYYQSMSGIVTDQKNQLQVELHSKQAQQKKVDRDIKETSIKVLQLEEGSIIRKNNEAHVEDLSQLSESLTIDIAKLKEDIPNVEEETLTLEEFLNVSKNAGTYVKSGNAVVKDYICRLIFANVWIDGEKVTMYRLKEPFSTLLKGRDVQTGRGGRNRTCAGRTPCAHTTTIRHPV